MKISPIVTAIAITFSLACCTTVQTYEGEPLPLEDVAVIKSNYWGHLTGGITVREIDGKKVGLNPGDVMVLPGLHYVKIRVSHSLGYLGTIIANGTVTLYAEAGHTYRVDGRIYRGGESVLVWIVDEDTGQIVAGRRP